MLTHALYDKRVSRSIVYLASELWLDTESLGFNAEVRGLGQFEIRLSRISLVGEKKRKPDTFFLILSNKTTRAH